MNEINFKWRTVFAFEGETDELLSTSKDGSMVMTRLFNMPETMGDPEREEIIDVAITSVNPLGGHKLFDVLRGHRLRVNVYVDDERSSASWWEAQNTRE